jgi:hypothetical protein
VGTITVLVNGTQGLASTFTAVVSLATTAAATPAAPAPAARAAGQPLADRLNQILATLNGM